MVAPLPAAAGVVTSLSSTINPPSTHFRIVRRRKDRVGLRLFLPVVVVCLVAVYLSSDLVVVLLDLVADSLFVVVCFGWVVGGVCGWLVFVTVVLLFVVWASTSLVRVFLVLVQQRLGVVEDLDSFCSGG